MNINQFLRKTAFMLTAMLLSIGGMQAQECAYTDPFTSTPEEWGWPKEEAVVDGWTFYCYGHNANNAVVLLNNDANYIGYIKSPVISGGCNNISFQSGSDQLACLTVEILQEGEVVWTKTVDLFEIYDPVTFEEKFGSYSFDNLGISGDFQVVFRANGISLDDPCILPETIEGTSAFPIYITDICINKSAPPVPPHNYQFNVPKDATVFVGDKNQGVHVLGNYLVKHYIPFTPQPEVHIAETDTSNIWYYNLPAPTNNAGGFSYRVTRPGKAPHVGLFKHKAGTTVESDTLLVFTDEQLSLHNAKDIDHDVNSLEGRNVADMMININAQGHLTLPLQADTAFQIINTRNWQAIDTDVNNYFIEPDFHYTVVDENGNPSNSVIAISDSGLITPLAAGTAIVLVDYDAMMCHHTSNVVPRGTDVKTNPAFFGASWGENTAVFVVSVAQPEAGITTNMNLNPYWAQDGTDKTDGIAIDAEIDVLYFEEDKGSFPYTFKPEGVTQVLVATPTVTATATSYSGFKTDSVSVDAEGNYTVRLGFGRNIVKLVSAAGATYQVITAKPVTYTVSNVTTPGGDFKPGDEVSVKFNTLYHPANKMSGIYNMSAGIQYTGESVNFPLILGPGQYTFASRAQEYKITIPEDFTGSEYVLTNGVIKIRGFGSLFGAHREISSQNGVPPNLSASVREAYAGSLPEIRIPMEGTNGIADVTTADISVYPNPFTDYIMVNAEQGGKATIYDLSGSVMLSVNIQNGSNRIETSALPKGVYVLKVGLDTVKIVK